MRYLFVTGTVVAAIFISTLAMAQQYGHGFGGDMMNGYGMMGDYSGLSTEKQAELNTLTTEHHKILTPIIFELRAKKAELDSLLVTPKFNESKVNSLNKEINDLYSKISGEKTKFT